MTTKKTASAKTRAGSSKRATAKTTGKQSPKKKVAKSKVASVKTNPSDRRKITRKPYKSPLGLDVQTLEQTFKLLEPKIDAVAKRFYQLLFTRYPSVVPLFKNVDKDAQAKKLVAALKLVVDNLRSPNVLVDVLSVLGERHQSYGAKPEHYAAVAMTLLDVLKEFTGDMWTNKVQDAWSTALETIAATMLKAYGNMEDTMMAATKIAVQSGLENGNDEVTKLKAAVDGSMTAMMMVDRDLVINYVNTSTMELLRKHQTAMASVFPGFNPENIIGTCIDTFHKNPAHQRQLLSDPNNLPYQKDIAIGELKFSLNVTAQVDDMGNYIGNTLEWADVTEVRQKETEVKRLQATVDSAMTAFMMIDRDLVITYANDSTVALLRKHEETLRGVYPGFSAENVMGTCIDTFHKNPAHQRQLLGNPANLPYSTDIQVGPLIFNINVTAIMNGADYVGNALEWQDVTELRAKELDVARLQSAVDGAEANLMLCDEDLKITFANPAVVNMLSNRQSTLQQLFPGFDAQNLIGTCIDVFHKNPAHQRALLKDLSKLPATAEIKVADLEFRVNATGVVGPAGEYMGNMVQWTDITEQKEAERQIASLIDAATQGALDERVDADSFEGFLKGLAEGINQLMEAVVSPVRETKRIAELLAKGDLTEQMSGEFDGEFADLRDSMNESVTNLLNMVNDIREGSGNIASSAGEIAQGNADLSQRTEEQASSLEETASSMEELTSTVNQNADNARQANQLATSARDEASKGGEVVGKAVSAMAEINSSSKKIADIIGVIDEIAFQTNLLALNAAVEAARAGEQGRGFAVVAAEVRNLAQRSAGAAKEIKSLISDSVEKVEEGSRLVDQSGETLGEIVGSIKKVSDIVAEIASASQEQASGIEQVNKAITQMDEVTQQNAALVEEAAASSESLDEQANNLDGLMNFFNVGDDSQQRSRSARPQPPSRPAAAKPARASRKPAQGSSGGGKYENDSEWEEF